MHNHHIVNMSLSILQAMGGDEHSMPQTYDKIMKALNKYWKNKIADVWSIEDIIDKAETMGIYDRIDKKDCAEILNDIMNDFDTDIGINWDVIESSIDYYMELNAL